VANDWKPYAMDFLNTVQRKGNQGQADFRHRLRDRKTREMTATHLQVVFNLSAEDAEALIDEFIGVAHQEPNADCIEGERPS
jgi:hypothetical protein